MAAWEEPVRYRPIGVVRTPFSTIEEMPIQPAGAAGVRGRIELRPELAAGLQDLAGFSHLWLVYHFHRCGPPRLVVTPFLDPAPRGVFATRAPVRPNPIGLSLVELVAVDGPCLHIAGVDLLDGTPLLDLKPYVPAFDQAAAARTGWLEEAAERAKATRADRRFEE